MDNFSSNDEADASKIDLGLAEDMLNQSADDIGEHGRDDDAMGLRALANLLGEASTVDEAMVFASVATLDDKQRRKLFSVYFPGLLD